MFARPSEGASAGRVRVAARVLAALVLVGLGARSAHASVSIALAFDDLVQRAAAVAVVIPTEKRTVWENGRIATFTHVRVARTLAGAVALEMWVRTQGGAVGHIGQIVEGEATFTIGTPSLVFLLPHHDGSSPPTFGVVEGAQGQFALVQGGSSPHLAASAGGGALVAPPAGAPRLARDVLVGRSLEDAAHVIQAAWSRKHLAGGEGP